MWHPDSAQPHVIACRKAVNVKPRAGANVRQSRRSQPLRKIKIPRCRQLQIPFFTLNRCHLHAGFFRKRNIIGQGNAGISPVGLKDG